MALLGPQRMNLTDFDDPLAFPLAPPWGWQLWHVSTTIGWFVIRSGPDIHVPPMMNRDDFDDPLTSLLAPSQGPNFYLSNTLFYNHLQKDRSGISVLKMFFHLFPVSPLHSATFWVFPVPELSGTQTNKQILSRPVFRLTFWHRRDKWQP